MVTLAELARWTGGPWQPGVVARPRPDSIRLASAAVSLTSRLRASSPFQLSSAPSAVRCVPFFCESQPKKGYESLRKMSEAKEILAEIVPESEITPALLQAAQKALSNFCHYDKSQDGRLSYDEFKKIPETAHEAEFVFKLMDLDHNKYISKKEFIQFIAADALGKSYKPYFDSLDKNHDGGIDVEEFEKFMENRGFTHDKVRELVEKMDTDKSGKVDYQEFRNFFARL